MVAKSRPGSMSKSSIDTGWGLIYRLNTLFNKAEDASLSGDFDKWNFILDRLFVNLCYKGVMDIKFDSEEQNVMPTRVLSINLPIEEQMVFTKFRQLIRDIKLKSMSAIRKRNKIVYENCKEEHYKTLLMKDIWLRKIMMERGLYLKEFEFDPSRALFGG
jgi:hypothetical protein